MRQNLKKIDRSILEKPDGIHLTVVGKWSSNKKMSMYHGKTKNKKKKKTVARNGIHLCVSKYANRTYWMHKLNYHCNQCYKIYI